MTNVDTPRATDHDTAETPSAASPPTASTPIAYLAIPSHDGRMPIQTMVTLTQTVNLLGPMALKTAELGNIPRARNACLEQIYVAAGGQHYATVEGIPAPMLLRVQDPTPPPPQWVLWIDSDILIRPDMAPVLAGYMQRAMEEGDGFLTHYNMADGTTVLMKDRRLYGARHYTRSELIALPDWAEVGMGGFGLAFLKMDLAYEFRATSAGEDIHFFLDHPDLTVHVAKQIILQHRKVVTV